MAASGRIEIEIDRDQDCRSITDSVCPSLDYSCENLSVDYDTDYFGGCHDVDGVDEEGREPPLSWRLDASQSLSDWKIRIHHQRKGCTTEYHVHKNILAVGPRKSEYFSSLFRCSDRLAESVLQTSEIVLEDMAADAFPCLLDFMYSPTDNAHVTTENAIALRYLAQYFGIRLLHKKVMDFLRQDINISTVNSYICDSFLFQDEKISGFVAETCAINIVEISPTSKLIQTVDPEFFLHIITSPEIDTCSASGHLSILVASYCSFHKDRIDYEIFRRLTHRNHMPFVDREASLPLLEMEADLRHDEIQQTGGGDAKKTSVLGEFSCLQQRCIKVLALHWKEVSEEGRLAASAVFDKLHSSVLLELLDKSLSIAKQRLEEAVKSVESQRVKLEQEFDVRLSKSVAELERNQEVLERVHRNTTETISHLRLQLVDRDRQLAELRRELGRFCRVPTSYSFSDIKRSTYHHLSQSEPFDNATYLCQFGRRRPTAMPRFGGDKTEDGYLFVTQRGSVHERWPVFYYKDD